MAMRYLKNVVTLELDAAKCIGCGMCTDVCPHAVFVVENRKAKVIDRDACMECGACARNCPVEAVRVEPGVGCAGAVIQGALRKSGASCGCSKGPSCGS